MTGSGERRWSDLIGRPDEVEDVDLWWRLVSTGQQRVEMGGGWSHSLFVHNIVQVSANRVRWYMLGCSLSFSLGSGQAPALRPCLGPDLRLGS